MRRLAFPLFAILAIAMLSLWLLRAETDSPERSFDSTNQAQPAKIAVPETGASVTPDAPEGAQDCATTFKAQLDQLYEDELTERRTDQIIDEVTATYRASGADDLQVFAAMLTDEPAERIDLYQSAINAGASSPFLLWSALNTCLTVRDTVDCPARNWLERLLTVDSENSQVWMRAAWLHHQDGDSDRALEAVRRAALAYESSSYWPEAVDSAKAGIDAIGGFSEPMGFVSAIGFAAAYPSAMQFVGLCLDKSRTDSEWAQACHAYAEQVLSVNTSIADRSFARSIRADTLIAQGEPEDSERIRMLRRPLPSANDSEILRYPGSILTYMNAWRNEGEIAALDALRAYNERIAASGQTVDCGDIRSN